MMVLREPLSTHLSTNLPICLSTLFSYILLRPILAFVAIAHDTWRGTLSIPILATLIVFDITDVIAAGVGVAPGRRRAIFIQGILHVYIAILTIGIILFELLLANLLTVILSLLYLHFTLALLLVFGIGPLDIDLYILI